MKANYTSGGRGEGLFVELSQFVVSLAPGEPAALLSTEEDPLEAGRWQLIALDPGEGYARSVAIERREWKIFAW